MDSGPMVEPLVCKVWNSLLDTSVSGAMIRA